MNTPQSHRQVLTYGDVPVAGPETNDPALLVAHRLADMLGPANGTVPVPDAKMDFVNFKGPAEIGKMRLPDALILRQDDVFGKVLTFGKLPGGIAGDALAGGRNIFRAAIQIGSVFPFEGKIRHRAVAMFDLAQLHHGLCEVRRSLLDGLSLRIMGILEGFSHRLLKGDVDTDPADADHFAVIIEKGYFIGQVRGWLALQHTAFFDVDGLFPAMIHRSLVCSMAASSAPKTK